MPKAHVEEMALFAFLESLRLDDRARETKVHEVALACVENFRDGAQIASSREALMRLYIEFADWSMGNFKGRQFVLEVPDHELVVVAGVEMSAFERALRSAVGEEECAAIKARLEKNFFGI